MRTLLLLVGIWVLFGVLGVLLHVVKWLIGAAIIVTVAVLLIRGTARGSG